MDREEFGEKVEEGLQGLEKEQVVRFTWHCAVMALPFTGSKGHFSFWGSETKRHLYAVLSGLDANGEVCLSINNRSLTNNVGTYIANAAYVSSKDAYVAAEAAYPDPNAEVNAVSDAAYAAYAAAHATYNAAYAAYTALSYAGGNLAYTTADTADAAADVAYAVFDAVDATVKVGLADLFYQKLLENIKLVKQGVPISGDVSIYGDVWPNFMQALEKMGCAYWGHLYRGIIESGFQLDQEALERRLNVPNEIQERGAVAVAHYLERIEREGARRLNEARILILGDKGSGKTCVARRLIYSNAPMTTSDESTPGVETKNWVLEEDNMNVRIWDFAGHTVTHAVHRFFLSERCLYIVVLSGRNDAKNLEYWLDHTTNYGGDSQVVILINRHDNHKVDIPVNTLKKKYKGILDVYDFSVRDDKHKLDAFRNNVRTYITTNLSWAQQQIPESDYKVKEALERIFVSGDPETGEEYISEERFRGIAEKCGATDSTDLLRNLHRLGVGLWYEELGAFKTLVLNPEWISHGVYQIVNWLSNKDRHTLQKEKDYAKIFQSNADRYPSDKYAFLSELMTHYELAFETEDHSALIVPHLLNEDQPATLPEFSPWNDLMLRYESLQPLPTNIIARFIVRHHNEIKRRYRKKLFWRHGVVLEDAEGNQAQVIEEDRTIIVSVKGNRKAVFLDRIRSTLNSIFESYKVQKPELQYQIRRLGETAKSPQQVPPLLVSEDEILRHSMNKRPIYDSLSNQDIPPADVIHMYQIQGNASFRNGDDIREDHSTNTTFHIQFKDCNVSLQGSLNALASGLDKQEPEEAEELRELAKALEDTEQVDNVDEVKKKGVLDRLQLFMEDLGDEGSKLNKAIKGVKRGKQLVTKLWQGYNKFAEMLGGDPMDSLS